MSEKSVLMINEDVEVRRHLREILVAADWQIEEASSALEGLKLIQDARSFGDGYNYILTEGFLPDCDVMCMTLSYARCRYLYEL